MSQSSSSILSSHPWSSHAPVKYSSVKSSQSHVFLGQAISHSSIPRLRHLALKFSLVTSSFSQVFCQVIRGQVISPSNNSSVKSCLSHVFLGQVISLFLLKHSFLPYSLQGFCKSITTQKLLRPNFLGLGLRALCFTIGPWTVVLVSIAASQHCHVT